LVTLDLQAYETVGGTEAGTYLQVERGILLAVPREGYRQTAEGARASLREQERLATSLGGPQIVLVMVDRVRDQDSAARRIWRDEARLEFTSAIGLIGVNPLARAIGAFFIGLAQPKVPTVLHSSVEEGIRWARALQRDLDARR
jgi:hypothetical protein